MIARRSISALFAALASLAAAQTYVTELAGVPAEATAAAVEVGGVRYLPIGALVKQWGGRTQPGEGKATLDLAGSAAEVVPDAARVTVRGQSYALSHAVVQRGSELYIAEQDLAGFMGTAFGLRVQERAAPRSRLEAATPGDETLPDIPPPLPTPLPAPPPAPAPAPIDEPAPTAAPMPDPVAAAPAPAPRPGKPGVVDTVAIDAGHGGADAGSVGPGGVQEKAVALAVAQRLQEALAAKGLKTVLVRAEDRDVPPQERLRLAREGGADLYVSLQTGASYVPQAGGVEVFYAVPPMAAGGRGGSAASRADYSAEGERFAQAAGAGLAQATGLPLRGVHGVALQTLSGAGMPALLIEVGTITNPAEAPAMASPGYAAQAAEGIAAGIAGAAAGAPS